MYNRYMYGFDWTYLLVIAGLILGLIAQHRVNQAYEKYAKVPTSFGRPAWEVANMILLRNGNQRVSVQRISGKLTDHYDPRNETLSLSEGVYDSSSVSAIGIAAHEAGHAMQKMESYAPLALRSAAVPVVNIGSRASMPIYVLCLVLSVEPLVWVGIGLFSLAVIFALITLPVELNASSRALRMLQDSGVMTEDELAGVRHVLRAAAMTYVASALASLLTLVRLLLIAQGSSRRRRD